LTHAVQHDALVREALRLHGRYLREVVERFVVCPWARAASVEQKVRAHVVAESRPSPHVLLPVLAKWASDELVDVGFVIVPRFAHGRDAFDAWTEELGAHASDVFVAAAFHPDADRSAGTVRMMRRTPDPTAQLVRRSRLEALRAKDPPHYRDIFDLNLGELCPGEAPRTVAASVLAHNERLLRERHNDLEAVLRDIGDDRERTYARMR
jgi:hypothetical protein